MLAGILNFEPKDPRQAEEWALQHFADHQEIQQAIQKASGTNLTIWEIYPLDMTHWDVWALKHQSAHNEMNTASGLSGDDLTQLNFKNRSDLEDWNYKHFREHEAQRVKYGI